MAIADIVRRGYAATIGKVVTRGYTPLEPPTALIAYSQGSLPSEMTSQGSLTTATSQGSIQ
jgi:hypothetical protein